MADFRAHVIGSLVRMAPRYLPFADVATPDLPLARLLRLSLFQISVGMALVLLVGTLNRVMIVELQVPAAVVGLMLALPLVFAPFRALIGHKSDTHRSALGWRRVPYIWKGTMLQFGGFAVMPFALLVLSGYGEAAHAPVWLGPAAAAIAFLLVGAGVHMVQTVGLALATDLVPEDDQPRVVGLMYVTLLMGMIGSALIFGALLEDYTPGRLIRVVQGAAVATIVLNLLAIWKQEARDRRRAADTSPTPEFAEAWAGFVQVPGALRLLVLVGLGTAGYGMADVLLEPYGGEVLGMSVAQTTRLTAIMAVGGLIGIALAARVLGGGGAPLRLAAVGVLAGLAGFGAIILSAYGGAAALFMLATLGVGIGAGIFGHATLTATMRAAPRARIGLALGAWGAVQATAAGIAVAAAGLVRDAVRFLPDGTAEAPYVAVFAIELILLSAALMAAVPLMREATRRRAAQG
jgi:BCD family chlorophyll transporter-like MFS transporter